jgi:large subunit ribosomal protein L21
MYVIVEMGSLQYKVAEGDVIEVNRLANQKDETIDVGPVLVYADGEDVRVGQPALSNVKVTAQVLDQTLDEKKLAFKFRCRKGYSRRVGHRQKLTALRISKIEVK